MALFTRDEQELHQFVTVDETWIHHFTLESNWQSAGWHAADESRQKHLKMQQSTGEVLEPVFWGTHGIIYVDYLENKNPSTATIILSY